MKSWVRSFVWVARVGWTPNNSSTICNITHLSLYRIQVVRFHQVSDTIGKPEGEGGGQNDPLDISVIHDQGRKISINARHYFTQKLQS